MAAITNAFTTIREVFTGTRRNESSSCTEQTSTQQEHLDTSDMAKILVIGETGAGKSTFINYLTNHFRQGSLKNIKVAIPSKFHPQATEGFSYCEHDIQNTTQSKTDACNQYMFIRDSKQYLFLDTPGLSDTRGAKQDDENILKIVDAVQNLGGLTAVIIVVNGAVSRLTVNLRNVIARLRGNLPDSIMNNVILVLTNSTRHAANFSVPALELNGNVYPYYMQNSAFSQDPSTWTATALEALEYDWNQAMDEIDAMIQTIDTFKTNSVAAFKQMKDIRNEIKTQMHAARLEVSKIQKMQDEISALDIALKQSNNDLVNYKDYTKEREVEKIEIVDASFHSTLCQNCNHVCHPKCGLTETTIVGAQIFQQCWAMASNGNCQQCQHQCPYTAHYHAKKTVIKSKVKLQDILHEIKAKFDQAEKTKSSSQQKITSTTDAKKLLEKAILKKNEEIKQLCLQLRKICSGFNIAQELHAMIDQLEIEAAILKNIEAKQQANAFIQSLKEFCKMLENDQNFCQNQSAKMNIINTERPAQSQTRSSRATFASNTSLTVQQNSNVNTSVEPAPDSGSYANDDVLQTIRAIGKKKLEAQKNKKTKATGGKPILTDESEMGEEESSTGTDEERSDKEMKKYHKRNKKQSKSNSPAPEMIDQKQFKNLTIQELIAEYHKCTDQRKSNFIVCEMMQRSHGESVNITESPESIVEFTVSTNKYCALGKNALNREYERLKSQIAAITVPDILKINEVPSALLFEIAAVYRLLQRAPPEDNPSPSNSNSNQHSFRPIVTNYNDNNRSVNHSPNDYSGTLTSPSLNTRAHPQFNQPAYSRESLHQPHRGQYYYDERYQTRMHTDVPPPYDNPHGHRSNFSHETQQSAQQFVQNTTSIAPSSSSSNLPKTFANMHLSADHPNSVSSSNVRDLSSAANGGNTSEEIRKMNNSQLLTAYNDAFSNRNHAKSHALYNELERRCYGDHSLLMREKQSLFDDLRTKYQGQSLIELEQLQHNIRQKISDYLINGDATYINHIPVELIVEAGALADLIATANSHA